MIGTDYPPNPPRWAWYAHLEDADGQERIVTADYREGVMPPKIVEESSSWTLIFRPSGRDSDPHHWDRYALVEEITTYAGDFVYKRPMGEPPRYRDQSPDGTASTLVGLEPGHETPATTGVWGLIDDYATVSEHPESYIGIELSLTYLASMDDYESRAEVEAELSY